MTTSSNSKTMLPQGIILILVGLVAFFLPLFTTFSITLLLGIVTIVSSCIYLISSFAHRDSNFVSQLCIGLIGLAIGILLLTNGLTIVSILLGIWFLLFSFAMFHRAFTVASTTWGMIVMIIAAIIAILFAIELFAGWPFSGIKVLGEMIGIVLVLQGISFLCRSN